MRRAGALSVVVLVAAHLPAACTSDVAPAPDAGATVADAATPEDGYVPWEAGEEPDPSPPRGLPDGWVLERRYSKLCEIYVPARPDVLPSVSWEPCPEGAQPEGVQCDLLRVQPRELTATMDAVAETGWTRDDGRTVFGLTQAVEPGWGYQVLASDDGVVYSALLATAPSRCVLAKTSIHDNRYAMRVFEYSSSYGGGLLAGELDALAPRLGVRLDRDNPHTPYAAPFAILDLSSRIFHQYSWTDGSKLDILWSGEQDDGLQQGVPVFAKGAAFWPSSNAFYHKVKVYTPGGGVRDFLSAGMVTTRGFGDLGTDGQDLV
jgi:hypothetical protein